MKSTKYVLQLGKVRIGLPALIEKSNQVLKERNYSLP
jgi:hypothetical protein